MSLCKIDKSVTQILADIEKTTAKIKFTPQFTFTLNGSQNYQQLVDKLKYQGLYLIEIRKPSNQKFNIWLANFRPLWEDPLYIHSWVPNIKDKRVSVHLKKHKFKDWVPLYIGKSHKISMRIKQHIDLDLGKSLTALKLRARTNIYGNEFRVSTIKTNVKNYNMIIPEVENYLRDKYNPITGKQ